MWDSILRNKIPWSIAFGIAGAIAFGVAIGQRHPFAKLLAHPMVFLAFAMMGVIEGVAIYLCLVIKERERNRK